MKPIALALSLLCAAAARAADPAAPAPRPAAPAAKAAAAAPKPAPPEGTAAGAKAAPAPVKPPAGGKAASTPAKPAPRGKAAGPAAGQAAAHAKASHGVTAPAGALEIPGRRFKTSFEHAPHAALACARCHGEGPPAKIAAVKHKAAHDFCAACHKAEQKGPWQCFECHQRGQGPDQPGRPPPPPTLSPGRKALEEAAAERELERQAMERALGGPAAGSGPADGAPAAPTPTSTPTPLPKQAPRPKPAATPAPTPTPAR